ncbi:Na-translocating system protein MpsC family protein [Ammoniphilus sp. YIM 78166]|uniref:Na-translocating system protein MpsC family protein n=1 Tax=Ammoniphilus sp. YIM 78166 TaxID=1644106 RepID=UPI00106F61E6|nr:Na-translocating system protein MpsC family protein [Ammoniphilus sp. YIM 78166]
MRSSTLNLGLLKQELMKDYQEINQQLFGNGTKHQRVDILGDKIMFIAAHRRAPAIRALDGKKREATRMMDILLIDEFKEHFKQKLESKYPFKVVTILKDYDPFVEISATVVVLDRMLETSL